MEGQEVGGEQGVGERGVRKEGNYGSIGQPNLDPFPRPTFFPEVTLPSLADSLVACSDQLQTCPPQRSWYLRDGDAAFLGKLLLGLLAGIRVAQVRVEIFIQDLGGLLAEIASLPPVHCVRQRGGG